MYLAGVGQTEVVRANQIEMYAKKVRERGFYLEAVDAELFCRYAEKKLTVAVHESSEPMIVRPALAYWSTIVSEDGEAQVLPDVQRSDQDTICLISCNAQYDGGAGMRNHWMPAFFKEQLCEEQYHILTVERPRKIFHKYQAAKTQARILKQQHAEGLFDSDVAEMMKLAEIEDSENEALTLRGDVILIISYIF